MKAKIVKITNPPGQVGYVIYCKRAWWPFWYTANGHMFATIEGAEKDLCWYDGTGYKHEDVT